ncbi:MAG: penicillin-binding transpeptidase domain-containing protein [Nitriliruptorales bacterium]|nr:penicillin-binding transpeptidase domain-containing protein [Nitriliruptorales bacterium]
MRDRIVALGAALLVLAAVGAGAWALLTFEEPDPEAEAGAAIDDYLAAWERWDTTAMSRFVLEPPEDFAALHEQMETTLEPSATRITRGDVMVERGTATTELTVTLELPYADPFAYDTALTAQREGDEWLVVWSPSTLHPELRSSFTWRVDREEATRAPILAADGSPLTSPGDLHTLGLWPARIEDPEEVQSAFDTHVPGSSEDVAELLADDLNPDWFYPVATLRTERFESVWEEIGAIPGIVQRSSEERLAPTDGFALHVLGAVETLDEEAAAERGAPYAPGDVVGRYGLEAAFDEQLRGSGAIRIVLAEPDGDVFTVVHEFEGDPAEPLETTLDLDLQRAAENALVGQSGNIAIVAVDIPTGAIRAVANRPLTGFNRAFEGRYPPGSVFKIVTAAAALQQGWAPDDEVDCPAEVTVGGRRITNLDGLDLGTVTLEQALAASCNTSFALLAADVGAEALADAAAQFGFGTELTPGLPAFGSSAPQPSDDTELVEAAIGQGLVEASVLHLAAVAATVGGGGYGPPVLIQDQAPVSTQTSLPSQVSADLTQLMATVVESGTGTAADLDGEQVHGKTGSAEATVDGERVTHAWFVGFRGDLAFAVLVEGGGSGGEIAAPLAARFLREVAAATS